jgi:hypothetical protein
MSPQLSRSRRNSATRNPLTLLGSRFGNLVYAALVK